jgi:uncharacterized protein YndB with AHSA1/START domain
MNQKWSTETKDEEQSAVKISREFDFPREAVFNMFTDAKKAAKFWGPKGAVKVVFELDPKPGGVIRIHDRDSEGNTGKTSGTITEIVAPSLLAFLSATTFGEGTPPWEVLQTVTFEALGPKRTRVTVLVKILATGSFPGGVESLKEGYQGGWGETFDMLQTELR